MTYNEQMAIHIASKFYDIELEGIRKDQSDNMERDFDLTAMEFKKHADKLLKKFNNIDSERANKEAEELSKKRGEDLLNFAKNLY